MATKKNTTPTINALFGEQSVGLKRLSRKYPCDPAQLLRNASGPDAACLCFGKANRTYYADLEHEYCVFYAQSPAAKGALVRFFDERTEAVKFYFTVAAAYNFDWNPQSK